MLYASALNGVPADKRQAFKQSLEAKINERLNNGRDVYLSVDYGAEGLLAETAIECKIACGTGSAFPVKTSMNVSKDLVEVSNGYRAPYKILYKAEKTDKEEKPAPQPGDGE